MAITENLSLFSIDSVVGVCAGFTLSWFITPMDTAVMKAMYMRAKGVTVTSALRGSLHRIITAPHRYMVTQQFRYVFGAYSATYLAKNYMDTLCKVAEETPERTAIYKFWVVFAVNGSLSVFWKDPGLARIVKTATMSTPTPPSALRRTFLWWTGRDAAYMVTAAVLPDYLEEKFKLSRRQWQIAQLCCPLLAQFVTTPLHLMGLDHFNHYGKKIPTWERVTRMIRAYRGAVAVRAVRMFCPWSIGLIINRELRDYLNGDVDDKSE